MATRFDPIRDLDRFFSEVTRTPNSTSLPMDLYRDGEVFIARIDMPGVDPDSIDVDVEDRYPRRVRLARAFAGCPPRCRPAREWMRERRGERHRRRAQSVDTSP